MKPTTYNRRSIIFDIANISYEIAISQKGKDKAVDGDPEMLGGLAMHSLLIRLHKFFKTLNPDTVVFAFEGGNNWRKSYTKSDACVSKKVYKSNRVSDTSMKYYYDMLDAFKQTCTNHTSIICLSVPGMEGDDAIASYCQQYASNDHEVIVISGDRDFTQLLRTPNVKLLNQRDGKFRNQPGDKKYYPDLEYFIFEKCVRGDKGDWVFPAYPRVKETRIRKAYEDAYTRANFMNETWSEKLEDGTERVYRVGDLFEENKILMDLQLQPPELRAYLDEEVRKGVEAMQKYSDFHFLKFLGQYKLKQIAEQIHKFQDMFVRNTKFAKGDLSYKQQKSGDDGPVDRNKTKTLAELQRNSNTKAFTF